MSEKENWIQRVFDDPYVLENMPDHYQTTKVVEYAIEEDSSLFSFVREDLKNFDLCEYAIELSPWNIEFVPTKYKTKELCELALSKDITVLPEVPPSFVSEEMYEKAYNEGEELQKIIPSTIKKKFTNKGE